MGGDFSVLQRVKLLEFIEAERKHVVVQRSGRTAEQTLQRRFITDRVTGVNGNIATDMPSRFALNAQTRIPDDQIQPATMRAAVERLVPFDASPLLEPEEHRTDKRHERAL